VLDTHTAAWSWGDGSTSAGSVTESNGSVGGGWHRAEQCREGPFL
jgi:hypothetical protein